MIVLKMCGFLAVVPQASNKKITKNHFLRLLSGKQPFCILVFGLDEELHTKWSSNWSAGLILGAFCTILRARPVGTGLGAKIGRKPAKKQTEIIICMTYSKRR